MATKPIVEPSTLNSQSKNRYPATFFDQHRYNGSEGRAWWGYREFAANKGQPDGFSSSLSPGNVDDPMGGVWEAPWYPESRFFEFDWRRSRIMIRYDRMIAELRAMEGTYYRLVNRMCAKNSWPTVSRGDVPRDAITDVLGDPPLSARIPDAARAAHPWLLGFHPEPDETLAKLLGLSVPAYGVHNVPKKAARIPLEEAAAMRDDDLDARIARVLAETLPGVLRGIVTGGAAPGRPKGSRQSRERTPGQIAATERMRAANEAKRQQTASAGAA